MWFVLLRLVCCVDSICLASWLCLCGRYLLGVCVIMLRYLVGIYGGVGYLLIACMLVLGLLCGLGLACGVWGVVGLARVFGVCFMFAFVRYFVFCNL